MEKSAGPRRGRGNCVKILLPGMEEQGLAGSGEQTAPLILFPFRWPQPPESIPHCIK